MSKYLSRMLTITVLTILQQTNTKPVYTLTCLFVLEFYGPVNKEVMSSRSVNSGTVPGQA